MANHSDVNSCPVSATEVNTGYQRQVNLQDSPPLAENEDTARNTPLGLSAVLPTCCFSLMELHLLAPKNSPGRTPPHNLCKDRLIFL